MPKYYRITEHHLRALLFDQLILEYIDIDLEDISEEWLDEHADDVEDQLLNFMEIECS